ncbi:MAG: hypothetical protein K2X02_06485 [Alphaproteobacteria bacterium]|nr:hypothetical protein [Alphaproteobacteria bacterium]
MILWNNYRLLSEDFLRQHHDLVLYDVFHQVVAFLLHPPPCRCDATPCQCDLLRKKISFSLNLDLFNFLQEIHEDSEFLSGARLLLKVPQESYFQKNYTQAYPSWLTEKNFHEEEKNFKAADQLTWALLRLCKTYQLSYLRETRTSISESLEVIFGNTPVKTKQRKSSQDAHGGEHFYKRQFKRYKSVCHLIAALQFMKKPKHKKYKELVLFSWDQADQIEHFLRLSAWFRQKLLLLQTPNTKKKDVFLPEEILPLPSWVVPHEIDIPMEPFAKKLEEINAPFVEYLNSKDPNTILFSNNEQENEARGAERI